MIYLSRHLAKETAYFLQQLRFCSPQLPPQNSQGATADGVAEWFDPALSGSVSSTEAALIQRFLQHAFISHAQFFATVLGRVLSTSSGLQAETGVLAALRQ